MKSIVRISTLLVLVPAVAAAAEAETRNPPPNNAALCIVFYVIGVALLTWLYDLLTEHSFIWAIGTAIRTMSLLAVVLAPLFFVASRDAHLGIATLMTGVLGFTLATLMFWREFYPRRTPEAEE